MKIFTKLPIAFFILGTPLAADPVNGLFASLNLGGVGIFQNHEYTSPSNAVDNKKKLKIGTSFGLSFGILHQVEQTKVVAGGEVSASLNKTTQKYDLNTGGDIEGSLSITNPYSFGAYGIAGMMMTPKLMFYAKAGYAWMRAELKYTNLNKENPSYHTYKKTMSGLSGGPGVNYLLTNKFMIGGEYLYYRPNQITPRNNDTAVGGQKRKFVYSPTVHTVSLKLTVLF